jgi:hypothetical protein
MKEFLSRLNEEYRGKKQEWEKEKQNKVNRMRIRRKLEPVPTLPHIRFKAVSFFQSGEYEGYIIGARVDENQTYYLVAPVYPYDKDEPCAFTGWVKEEDIVEVL